ncbi:hypothetical protein M316_0143 [Nitrincola phage 1M3-16]|uniref:hypothetical protein n=1 Tax=Nitrincola phage 1M3-16 TaxID=1472912 RepID=UPI000444BA4E|nr:hypothetical protein GJ22_gp009 [Nitrincola phage 1M3-16]AHX01208.1 hypothetical protein M316_0143 [Nitrincola phage 1M3-16]
MKTYNQSLENLHSDLNTLQYKLERENDRIADLERVVLNQGEELRMLKGVIEMIDEAVSTRCGGGND